MITAHTSARLQAATKLTQARECLNSIRSLICFSHADLERLDSIDDTLCDLINATMQLHDKSREFIGMIARMQTEEEFVEGDAPPSEDWISTLNDLIKTVRDIHKSR